MKAAIKKISIMSLALAGLILPEKGMGTADTTPGEINQPSGKVSDWYKKLAGRILKGDACEEGGIFREKSGAVCKYKDAAELYILICREKLGDKLLKTQCGTNASKWGSDFITGAEQHVIGSTKSQYTNLYWLICTSDAPSKNKALERVKAAACKATQPAQPLTAPAVTAPPTPWASATPSRTGAPTGPKLAQRAAIEEALKPQPIPVMKAITNLPKRQIEDLANLEDELRRMEANKIEIKKLDQAGKLTQEAQAILSDPKMIATEQQALTVLKDIKIKAEAKNPPKELTSEEEKRVEELMQGTEYYDVELENRSGVRTRGTKVEFLNRKTGQWGANAVD